MRRPKILPLLAALPWLATAHAAAAAELVEGVAAIVGSDIILLSELEQAVGPVLARVEEQQGPVSPETKREIRSRALQSLIDSKLITEYAERTELAATPQEIDETVAGIAADERVSVEDIYGAAEKQGLPRNSYRRELGNQITRMKLMGSTIRGRVKVSDDDVRKVFEERYKGNGKPGQRARVRALLLPWPPDPAQRDFARSKAEQLRAQAEASGQFAAIAAQFGGTVTTLNQAEISPEVAKFVFEPPPGTISPVIETPAGMQLFQVLERFDPDQIQFEDVEARLRQELQERGVEPEFAAWLKTQREEAYIRVVAPDLQ
jgi:peptidyl-prolyl cis-trans isomerase SurA